MKGFLPDVVMWLALVATAELCVVLTAPTHFAPAMTYVASGRLGMASCHG